MTCVAAGPGGARAAAIGFALVNAQFNLSRLDRSDVDFVTRRARIEPEVRRVASQRSDAHVQAGTDVRHPCLRGRRGADDRGRDCWTRRKYELTIDRLRAEPAAGPLRSSASSATVGFTQIASGRDDTAGTKKSC